MAITIGILVEIILMILFCCIEVLQREVLNSKLAGDLLLLVLEGFTDDRFVFLVDIVDAGTILRAVVMALLVDACRIIRF